MTSPDRDPVRELIELARELRRSEQPTAECFEAALGRLSREELARSRASRLSPSPALNGLGRWLPRPGPALLGLALALALAVLVSWGARSRTAIDAQQDEPGVAFAPEPARVPDATRAVVPAHHREQPGAEEFSVEQRPALPAAPSATPLPSLSSEPLQRAKGQVSASGPHESSSALRRPHVAGSALESGSDPFYPGAPPASILWLDDIGAARLESSGDERKVAGFWTVENWSEELSPRHPAMRQLPDRRQCVDVPRNERLVLRWRSRGGPDRQGFELLQGQRYRLILPRVSVIGPVQLELIAIVGSSDASHGPALVTHVMSTPTPSTVGFTFEPHHDDARAPVSLFVDAVGPSGATKLCLGALRFESVPAQADAGAAAAEENAQRAAQRRGEPEKLPAANVGDRRSADKTAGTKERGKENAAPKRSTKKPADKPAGPPKTSCNPPWYFDTKGIRRLKPECL